MQLPTGWELAAYVFAWTYEGSGGHRTGPKAGQLSLREFSELGIRGLKKRDTVTRYRKAWAALAQAGLVPMSTIVDTDGIKESQARELAPLRSRLARTR